MTDASDASDAAKQPSKFVSRMLPLYHGPLVKIRLKPSDREYKISKGLLCAESRPFTAMFKKDGFKESQELAADLEEQEDVVTVRSVEALIEWVYTHTVRFDIQDHREKITAAMELARLADLYFISGVENDIAQYIAKIIVANPHPQTTRQYFHTDNNTHLIDAKNIVSATYLRPRHPVRRVLAEASVAGYLRNDKHKFADETEKYPSFGADLLLAVRSALNKREEWQTTGNFHDPISGKSLEIGKETFGW
ncbi:hypothetical protein N7528_004975 [Penicillium herquei]|nr:hypothetical protein N7528_004975 [Penicillium herquei]